MDACKGQRSTWLHNLSTPTERYRAQALTERTGLCSGKVSVLGVFSVQAVEAYRVVRC
jgi:hypothetical protein